MPVKSMRAKGLRHALVVTLACFGVGTGTRESRAEPPGVTYKFDFGPGKAAPGYVPVTASMAYSHDRGFGFDLGSKVSDIVENGDDPLHDGGCSGDRPFFFSVTLPEGNYDVSVTLGDRTREALTTVKAESRRLVLEGLRTEPGLFVTRTFTVNVRGSQIASGGEVKLKAREKGVLHWDDKLTLEFNGNRPVLCALEIVPAPSAITVYLAGDSTVTDQPREPWNSWGQMLPRFFQTGVAVANHAESGESLKSFVGSKRLDKILSVIRPGDYLFIQFGHNDQKERGEGVGAFTTYQASLKRFVAEARRKQAIPVLVTPVSRRAFGPDGKITNNLGDYPEAVRRVAREENVPLIDLNAMSQPFYEALGVEGSKKAFVDNTHHNNYGSFELAKCVVEGIRQSIPELAKHLADNLPAFDPAHPDPVATFAVPPSPERSATVPDGS